MANSPATPEHYVEAMDFVLASEAKLFRCFSQAVVERLGSEGLRVLRRGTERYGEWRAQALLPIIDAAAGDLRRILMAWPTGELHSLMSRPDRGAIMAGPKHALIAVDDTPEWEEWRSTHSAQYARAYVKGVFVGMERALGGALAFSLPDAGPDLKTRWSYQVMLDRVDSAQQALEEPTGEPLEQLDSHLFDHESDAYQVLLLTQQGRAALYAQLARAIIDRFDATGEEAVRNAVRRFGTERGLALRAKHQSQGRPINLKSLMEDYDSPLEIWKFDEGGTLSSGTWHEDCTFCPFIPVWKSLNELNLGLIYDYELHLGQFTSYHPGIIVQWDQLQTRGDRTCQFRFSIPELREATDPVYLGRSNP